MRCIVGERNTPVMALAVAVMVAAIAARQCMAASSPPPPSNLPCMSQLTACTGVFNIFNPPAKCCEPMKQAYKNDMDCLCYVFDNPDVFGTFRVDMTMANLLFSRCNIINGSTTLCKSSPGQTTPINPPPADPNGSIAVHGTMWIGTYDFMFLLLFWWSFMA